MSFDKCSHVATTAIKPHPKARGPLSTAIPSAPDTCFAISLVCVRWSALLLAQWPGVQPCYARMGVTPT